MLLGLILIGNGVSALDGDIGVGLLNIQALRTAAPGQGKPLGTQLGQIDAKLLLQYRP